MQRIHFSQKIKRFFPYVAPVLIANMLITPIAVFLKVSMDNLLQDKLVTLSRVCSSFIVTFLTGGFIFGVLYYELARRREYYFYYNLGISKTRLLLVSFLIHAVLMVPVFILAVYA